VHRVFPLVLGGSSQLVWKTHLILPLSSTRVFVQDDDCAEAKAPLKGGDPTAPSGTVTLLRLRPSRQAHLRPLPPLLRAVGPRTSGVPDSHDVTGGVYKARVRIHRALLTRGY
jgi:hypothetical protein